MDTEGQAGPSLTPGRLGEILAALGGRIEDTDQVVELLQKAVDLAHDIIPGADSCCVTIDFDGSTYTATSLRVPPGRLALTWNWTPPTTATRDPLA